MTLEQAMEIIRADVTYVLFAETIALLAKEAGATSKQAADLTDTLLTSQATAYRLGYFRRAREAEMH